MKKKWKKEKKVSKSTEISPIYYLYAYVYTGIHMHISLIICTFIPAYTYTYIVYSCLCTRAYLSYASYVHKRMLFYRKGPNFGYIVIKILIRSYLHTLNIRVWCFIIFTPVYTLIIRCDMPIYPRIKVPTCVLAIFVFLDWISENR